MKIEHEDMTLRNTIQHSNNSRQQTSKVVCLQSSVTTSTSTSTTTNTSATQRKMREDHRISPIPPTSRPTSTSDSTSSSSFSSTTNNSQLSCKRKLLLTQSSVVFILATAISVSNMNALAFSSRGNNMNHHAFVNHKHYGLSLHNQHNQHNHNHHNHHNHLQPISTSQTRNSLISTTTTTTSLFAESTGQQEGKSVLGEKTNNDDDEWNTLVSAFKMYKAAYGDLKVPSRFVVPSMPPWPSKSLFYCYITSLHYYI